MYRVRAWRLLAVPVTAAAVIASAVSAESAPQNGFPASQETALGQAFGGVAPSTADLSSTLTSSTVTNAPTAGNANGSTQREVRAQYTSNDGVTHATVYDVADGYTADQAYTLLKAQGVKGLQDPSQKAPTPNQGVTPNSTPPEGSTCSYGTAHSIQCPPTKKWARNGYTNPQIYYYDHTGSRWPVGTAISTWNQSPNIHVAWSPSGCPSNLAYHCVDVSEAHNGANGTYGYTSWQWDPASGYFYNGTVNIQFNDDMYTNNLTIACHEIGHSFGMDHNDSTSSCMYSVGNLGSSSPSSSDYSLITAVLYPR